MRIEELIASSILQDGEEVIVGNQKMVMCRPLVGTIIETSKHVSKIPNIVKTEGDNSLVWVLAHGACYEVMAEVAAILILGRKNMYGCRKIFGINIPFLKVCRYKELAKRLLNEYSSEKLSQIISSGFGKERIGFFLSITTTLQEAKVLARTKTTQSGQ